jgi:hypothetical protein
MIKMVSMKKIWRSILYILLYTIRWHALLLLFIIKPKSINQLLNLEIQKKFTALWLKLGGTTKEVNEIYNLAEFKMNNLN